MNRQRLGLLLLAAVSCTPPPPTTPSSPIPLNSLRSPETPVLPRSLQGFEVIDTSLFEQPNSGVMYRYQGPEEFHPDVYVYPMPPQGFLCQAACRERVAAAEVATFRSSIPILLARGYADSIIDLQEGAVDAPSGAWVGNGYHLRFRLVRGGTSQDSHLFVFAGLETLVKFRATFGYGTVPDSLLDFFVQALLLQAPPPYTCSGGLSSQPGISVSVTLAEPDVDIATAIDAAFTQLGYSLDYRAPSFGRWRTLPSFEWPKGTASEDWHGMMSPGVTLFAMLAQKQDSVEATFTSQAVCQQSASRHEKEEEGSVLQTLTALQMTTAFDSILKAHPH